MQEGFCNPDAVFSDTKLKTIIKKNVPANNLLLFK